MLKAYDYVEYPLENVYLNRPSYFEKELAIAKDIVKRIGNAGAKVTCCPACRSKKISHFCEKWEVEYVRCEDCETVFAVVSEEEANLYRQSNELTAFRISEQYQTEAAHKKEVGWTESLDWITFRTYRYLGKNTGLYLMDLGNRYDRYAKMFAESPMVERYELRESILSLEDAQPDSLAKESMQKADIVLYLNQIQQIPNPGKKLCQIYEVMKDGALLFFSTRMGTGFDVLTLKEHANIFPYEHVFLPSGKGMEYLLSEAGFRILEYSTPGRMDVGTVLKQPEWIGERDYFVRSLIKNSDASSLAEFQRFLQKSGMSSYAQIVACKPAEQ